MSGIYRCCLLLAFVFVGSISQAQTIVRGQIIDAATKEPLAGATVQCTEEGCNCGCTTSSSGEFEMTCRNCHKLAVSSIGYATQNFLVSTNRHIVALSPSSFQLQEVVLSANRGEGAKRSEAPIAISTISSKVMQETKATSIEQVLNKVSGVNMVNLGNEQHQMSIRQPMTTKSLFLYLEDGIPIRASGLYNHNALLEMNMAAVKNIEVIKGPSSSLYGSEAIGGVINFITITPAVVPLLKLSVQGNNIGYKRSDLIASTSSGKWGFLISGYHAERKNGFLEYSDFYKSTFTARIDYRLSDKTNLTNSVSYLNYYSDMSGGIDSAMFASRTFSNLQTFTYRKVNALRYRSTLSHEWNSNSKTNVTVLFRDNGIGQNPAYRVKEDYRRVNGVFSGDKSLAHGEINENSFRSYSIITQHREHLNWKNSVLIGGVSVDLSPSAYDAQYIRIQKDTLRNKYVSYQNKDSLLTNYATNLNNYAAFFNYEFSPAEKFRIVASLRFDYFQYRFNNHLQPSAFSGSNDTSSNFKRVSPKVGFTYNFNRRSGVYANYSEGFVPPQVTELYTGVKVPDLRPAVFYNYEAGGWIELVENKLSADISAYHLKGTNEIVSVRLDDGSFANQNAGRTLHKGIEFGVNATPANSISWRLSGAYSHHKFVEFEEKGVKYDGNRMSNAPDWVYNTEIWYKPSFAKGLRVGAELQHVGRYFVDPQNSAQYKGYNVLNIRAGYRTSVFEIWINVLNATNNYFSYITSRSSFGYSYQVAEPRNFNFGISYDFANVFKQNR